MAPQSPPNVKPIAANEKKGKMSKEEKDKIKIEKGFAAMVAKRCC